MTGGFKIQSLPIIVTIPVRAHGTSHHVRITVASTSHRYILPNQQSKTMPHHGSLPTPARTPRLKFG